jgi:hypothetical protein
MDFVELGKQHDGFSLSFCLRRPAFEKLDKQVGKECRSSRRNIVLLKGFQKGVSGIVKTQDLFCQTFSKRLALGRVAEGLNRNRFMTTHQNLKSDGLKSLNLYHSTGNRWVTDGWCIERFWGCFSVLRV